MYLCLVAIGPNDLQVIRDLLNLVPYIINFIMNKNTVIRYLCMLSAHTVVYFHFGGGIQFVAFLLHLQMEEADLPYLPPLWAPNLYMVPQGIKPVLHRMRIEVQSLNTTNVFLSHQMSCSTPLCLYIRL